MPWSYTPEKVEEVRLLVVETTKPYPEIAKLTGVAASSISRWKCRFGWQRPEGAFGRRPIPKDKCAAAKRAMADGARYQEVAVMLDRSPDIVRRLCRAAPAGAPDEGNAAEPPDLAAELWNALTASSLGRDDLLRHAPRLIGLFWAQLARGDASAPRRVEAMARTAAFFTKIPDPAGPAGAAHDPYAGPQTFDETNALIEELAQRLEAFAAQGDDETVPGGPLAGNDAFPH
jgi:hypothetical protein